MKTKKRSKIVSLLLALSMLVGMLPLSVIPAMAAGFGDVQITSSYPYDPQAAIPMTPTPNGAVSITAAATVSASQASRH